MIEMLRELSHWLVGFADSDWAVWVLAITSFTEAIFFPIPPDPLLIGMAIRQPSAGLWLAGIVTIASVGGAVLGHWLGGRFGRPLLYRLVKPHRVVTVEQMFQRYGAWAVLMAAFTPVPYKVFAITAGILALNMRSFIIASVVGRGLRFFLLGGLIFFFGTSIQEFLETRFELVMVLLSVALVVGLVVAAIVMRKRRNRTPVS